MEHAKATSASGAKHLFAPLEGMTSGADHYDAKVSVLGESIVHQMKEEQDEMFPKARRVKLDLAALGAQMRKRKQELQASNNESAVRKNASVA